VRRAILWFRRDLRLADHPALLAALDDADEVVPVFVLDPRLLARAGAPRTAFLLDCLERLRTSTGGALVVRPGDPAAVVPALAAEVGAGRVFVTAETTPYGRTRDARVARRVPLEEVGTPYAVPPGAVVSGAGTPYRVFTPYLRAWTAHGWPLPRRAPRSPAWVDGIRSHPLPARPETTARLPAGGEEAALRRLRTFLGRVDAYATTRDRADLDATSRLSPYLRFGCVHPRQVLARLGSGAGPAKLRSELAWREFYADVLAARPETAWRDVRADLDGLAWDEGPGAGERFEAWASGRTGYPMVDAGMRQLLAEGWVPNRVRMIVASFLVKDLHLDWRLGARWFLGHLVDGDLASNNHNWQWVAGTGTDPSPFVRVFNPVLQGRRHDPDGDYVRRWVPELRGVPGPAVHEPWTRPEGPPAGYPERVVDHDAERLEALSRYAAATGTR
jgi:deoxyribodipyrimidine photo-lyase